MSNILAIAHKELKSYFASPIAYIVIGLLALLYGYFFVAILQLLRPPEHADGPDRRGPQPMNINQQLIRPLLQNVTILMLFLMPMVTMRTYSEEKRSGTIELLLTSPLTDFQIIIGKFLGAMALYAVMLAVTLIHIGDAVHLRQPGMEADPHRLPRPAAARRLLHLARAVHLEPDQEPDRRRHGDLRGVPAAVDHHAGSAASRGRRSTS